MAVKCVMAVKWWPLVEGAATWDSGGGAGRACPRPGIAGGSGG